MAYAFASEDLLKEITYEFFEEGWMSSSEASLALSANHSVFCSQRDKSTFCGQVPIISEVSHLPA